MVFCRVPRLLVWLVFLSITSVCISLQDNWDDEEEEAKKVEAKKAGVQVFVFLSIYQDIITV